MPLPFLAFLQRPLHGNTTSSYIVLGQTGKKSEQRKSLMSLKQLTLMSASNCEKYRCASYWVSCPKLLGKNVLLYGNPLHIDT